MTRVLAPFKKPSHDHARCVHAALADAETLCARGGRRLTALRRQVLALVWGRHAPVKAYEILEHLQRDKPGAAPPTVYRALEFLLEMGLIHRIESLNAYVGCGDPRSPHGGQFLICRGCGTVAEINEPKITRLLSEEAAQLRFVADDQTVEIRGLCPQCQG